MVCCCFLLSARCALFHELLCSTRSYVACSPAQIREVMINDANQYICSFSTEDKAAVKPQAGISFVCQKVDQSTAPSCFQSCKSAAWATLKTSLKTNTGDTDTVCTICIRPVYRDCGFIGIIFACRSSIEIQYNIMAPLHDE